LPLEARYLIFASNHLLPLAPGEVVPVAFGIPALAVIFVGIQQERSLGIVLPELDIDPQLVSFVEALAAASEGPRAEELRKGIAAVQGEQRHRITLSLHPDISMEDSGHIVKAHNRPPTAVTLFAVHVLGGGGPVFGPSSSPSIKSVQAPR
jgi:hypothetical protein